MNELEKPFGAYRQKILEQYC